MAVVPPTEIDEMRTVTCKHCDVKFLLEASDYGATTQTVMICSCESAGVYNCFIQCPHCQAREDIHGCR